MDTSQTRHSTAPDSHGSSTLTLTGSSSASGSSERPVPTLHLRGGPRKPRQRVVWSEEVVDNEGCGRKSSKICCIYNKPKKFDESSDEDSSDSDSDSDCGHHHHSHPSAGPSSRQLDPRSSSSVQEIERPAEPNAYERAPDKGKHRAP
ncbi:type 1 phosphatases regulator YPI1 [Flagelloscypha sp. PMI_526]|nr:type 1 phosphatases regulator YPI1 [Flagelloscypha sp. PMI_526]